ncbi:MAG TPA: 16S rRNA methyltransferase [Candidatus Dormibacteraeota bacterium]
MTANPVDHIVEEVTRGRKYRHVTPEVIEHVGAQELRRTRNLRDAVRATKNKLHQVGGAYLLSEMRYPLWLARLTAARQDEDAGAFAGACRDVMAHHASTRERLADLATFYTTLFEHLGGPRSIIDLGCGLNPLALPWMPLPDGATYLAVDIYQDLVDFLDRFFDLVAVNGRAMTADLTQGPPPAHADVALLLKLLPVLDQVDRGRGRALLHEVDASRLVVSYPRHSLGGRSRGMTGNYAGQLLEAVAGTNWDVKRLELRSELVFVVTKHLPRKNGP